MPESSPQSGLIDQQDISPVLQRLESRMRPLGAEQITRQVDKIFAKDTPSKHPVDMSATIARLKPAERADRLYSQLMAYRDWTKKSQKDSLNKKTIEKKPFNRLLMERMRGLWNDSETRAIFLQKYEEANIDYVEFKGSQLGQDLSILEQTIVQEQEQHQQLTKTLFLGSDLSADDQMEVKYELEDLVYTLSQQREKLETKVKLTNVEHTPENTDMVAMHEQARLVDMRRQLTDNNFIWFDSMVDNYQEALMALTNGRWPLFIGEAGTGKSALAVATSKVLTGEKPTLVACTSRTNEGHLIARVAMAGDKTYEEYGAAMQAATGYEDSRPESSQTNKTGRIVRLDELFKLGEDSPVFAFLKELAQLKPGDTYRRREILKGFKILATTNPSGTRYNNPEPNPALIREFAPIEVDYLKMSKDNPELYELMLVSLMDKRGLIAGCSKEELSPAYTRKTVDKTLPDGRKISAEQELIADPTDMKHGYLYRLAYALRSVQDAFIYGNGHEVKGDVLRTQADGSLKLGKDGELMTLSAATITPGDIRDWLEKYNDRRKDQHPIGKTNSLTEYLQEQLKFFVKQASPEDRGKLELLFKHFNVFNSILPSSSSLPITPKDIGYLSTRIIRPDILAETKQKKLGQLPAEKSAQIKYKDIQCTFEDQQSRLVNPSPMEIDKKGKIIKVKSGTSFILDGQKYKYIGHFEGKVVVDTGEGLHRLIDQGDVWKKGIFIESVAKELFGADFIGEEAIRAMEGQCKQAGIEAHFITDNVDLSYAIEKLEEAGKEKGTDRERFLVMRPSGVKFKDEVGEYDGPITISALKRLFKDKNPFGDGTLIYDNSWYEGEAFADQPLQAKYAMPTKKILPESRSKNWADQEKLLKPGETRREAIETLWDTIAYYSSTKQRLLSDGYDWSKTSTSHDDRVFVGDLGRDGVSVGVADPSPSFSDLGVCPAR